MDKYPTHCSKSVDFLVQKQTNIPSGEVAPAEHVIFPRRLN